MSAVPDASPAPRAAAGPGRAAGRVRRFSVTERVLHAVHATSFTVMLATGLILFLPALAEVFGNRPVVKAVHLAVAALWLTALLLVALLGDRAILHRTRGQMEGMTRQDLRWLRSRAARARPQGRFNGGQKLNAIAQSAFTILFFVSGTLMWLGERNTTFRLAGTIALHDLTMLVATGFVVGHVWIALSRTGRPALRGLVDGTVSTTYAREHHAAWDPTTEPAERFAPGKTRVVAASLIAFVGLAGAALLAGLG